MSPLPQQLYHALVHLAEFSEVTISKTSQIDFAIECDGTTVQGTSLETCIFDLEKELFRVNTRIPFTKGSRVVLHGDDGSPVDGVVLADENEGYCCVVVSGVPRVLATEVLEHADAARGVTGTRTLDVKVEIDTDEVLARLEEAMGLVQTSPRASLLRGAWYAITGLVEKVRALEAALSHHGKDLARGKQETGKRAMVTCRGCSGPSVELAVEEGRDSEFLCWSCIVSSGGEHPSVLTAVAEGGVRMLSRVQQHLEQKTRGIRERARDWDGANENAEVETKVLRELLCWTQHGEWKDLRPGIPDGMAMNAGLLEHM